LPPRLLAAASQRAFERYLRHARGHLPRPARGRLSRTVAIFFSLSFSSAFFSGGFGAQSRINFEEDHEARTFPGAFLEPLLGRMLLRPSPSLLYHFREVGWEKWYDNADRSKM
jgi:hypothetical protein